MTESGLFRSSLRGALSVLGLIASVFLFTVTAGAFRSNIGFGLGVLILRLFPFSSLAPEFPSHLGWFLLVAYWFFGALLVGSVTRASRPILIVFAAVLIMGSLGSGIMALMQLMGYKYVFEGP